MAAGTEVETGQAARAEASAPCISLSGVSKSFSGVEVLRDVSIDFLPGEIHGLIGENGAGKSTVGKIVGGYYSRSSGDLMVFGESVTQWDPPLALARGVAMMHQELQLVPALSVAENVFLGIEHSRVGFLVGDEDRRLADIAAFAGFDLDPAATAGSLSIADQQKVEIMRALAREARVIVMDEPTSSLTHDEAERLHGVMRKLRDRGCTIIYVSHFLDHVLDVCDTVTVMRDGAVIRTSPAANETKASLIAAMIGRPAADVAYPPLPPEPDRTGTPLLSVRGLVTSTGVRGADLHLWPGEIVGLVGLVGSGRTEIARAIFGADASVAGMVTVAGEVYADRSPRSSIERGLAMVPEDRRKQGLVLTQTVRPNITLPHLSAFARFGLVRAGAERSEARRLIDYFGVQPGHVDGEVANYSGGNQQKVVMGKWILGDPRIVILDEPSRGVDIGARRRIHEFIGETARRGAAILLISSEIEEVLGLAHRAYTVSGGRVTGEIVPAETTVDEVIWRLFHEQGADKAGATA
ncbi:sugar ABC transporter ATP-binding protein [Aquibium carbonis]|uniref:Sugar ABC transporter ATP-binding protein n=1 Tax=Aquibium carbonis TaxID=2495581 RepID=A0A429Z0H0_9HYPH|nr:sugar ABC transporter ATP-binding protein [Aquibium carbonis]RST87098.1 sugar ABC transporter ATP-binding protein [Aquibium carbonis]